MKQNTFTRTPSIKRIERIRQALKLREMTTEEIADAVFINREYARQYVKHLHQTFQIHICGYREVTRTHTWHLKVYAWGAGADAPPPKKPTDAERSRERRKDEEFKVREAAKARAKRIMPRRDWSASWIPTREAA